jgi:hypothetical protein
MSFLNKKISELKPIEYIIDMKGFIVYLFSKIMLSEITSWGSQLIIIFSFKVF